MARLTGRRVVITQTSAFMGPDLVALFGKEGAELVADDRDLKVPGAAEALIAEAGHVDVLVANLAAEQPRTSVLATDDATFRSMYEAMVYPLHRLVRAVLPQMIARRKGKIVVMGSASALRGMPNYSAYGSARGAQLAYVQDVGTEVAPHNVQVNAIAQTFVENPTISRPAIRRPTNSRSASAHRSVGSRKAGNRPRSPCFLPAMKVISRRPGLSFADG